MIVEKLLRILLNSEVEQLAQLRPVSVCQSQCSVDIAAAAAAILLHNISSCLRLPRSGPHALRAQM